MIDVVQTPYFVVEAAYQNGLISGFIIGVACCFSVYYWYVFFKYRKELV